MQGALNAPEAHQEQGNFRVCRYEKTIFTAHQSRGDAMLQVQRLMGLGVRRLLYFLVAATKRQELFTFTIVTLTVKGGWKSPGTFTCKRFPLSLSLPLGIRRM